MGASVEGPLMFSWNTLAHGHINPCLLSGCSSGTEQLEQMLSDLQSQKYLLSRSLQKMFANPHFRYLN